MLANPMLLRIQASSCATSVVANHQCLAFASVAHIAPLCRWGASNEHKPGMGTSSQRSREWHSEIALPIQGGHLGSL